MHYFDNAATTFPKPDAVYDNMDSFYRTYGVNVGRGQFREASVACHMIDETRDLILELFHASKQYSCVFTSSATEALNTILQGFRWEQGMTVYISPFEHNAVLRTMQYIQDTYDVTIQMLVPDKTTLKYDMGSVRATFSSHKPDVVVITHASNAFGNILPVEDIFALAKEAGAITICDMAQTAGLVDTDIVKSHIDYAVFAGHKTLYGPLGIAGFVTNQKLILSPLLYGGTGVDSKNPHMPEEMPMKYEAGSPNVHAISGLNAALKWIKSIGIHSIRQREQEITRKLLEVLQGHSNIRIVGKHSENDRIGVVSCVFDGYSSDNIGQVLSEYDIAVRTGLHCAPKAHEFLKTAPEGTVRFSVGYFTNEQNLNALNEVLDYIEMNG
jgi:cysteine desulfurase family protein